VNSGFSRLRNEFAVAEALWDRVAREAEESPLSAPQRAELRRRLDDSTARPDAVTPWEVVRERALARK
jgi:putative addiction module component (TIGR02574 family)